MVRLELAVGAKAAVNMKRTEPRDRIPPMKSIRLFDVEEAK
jgi:hypothetical protein